MCGEKDALSSQARYHCTSNRGGKLSCRKAQRCKVSCRSQASNYSQSRHCKAGSLGIFWLDVRAARCGLSCVILRAWIPFLPTLWDGLLMLHTQWKKSPFPDCWVPDSVLCFKLNNTQYEESISGCPCCFQAPTLSRFTWTILAICFQAGFLYYGLWSLPDLIHSLVLTQYNWNLISFPGTEPGNFFFFFGFDWDSSFSVYFLPAALGYCLDWEACKPLACLSQSLQKRREAFVFRQRSTNIQFLHVPNKFLNSILGKHQLGSVW